MANMAVYRGANELDMAICESWFIRLFVVIDLLRVQIESSLDRLLMNPNGGSAI